MLTKEGYFSNQENKKIKLLCYLTDAKKFDINNTEKLQNILDDKQKDLDQGLI